MYGDVFSLLRLCLSKFHGQIVDCDGWESVDVTHPTADDVSYFIGIPGDLLSYATDDAEYAINT